MDMNNKDNNNVEVLDGVSNTPVTPTPIETLDLGGVSNEPTLGVSSAQVETLIPDQSVVPTLDSNVVNSTVAPASMPVSSVVSATQSTVPNESVVTPVEATPIMESEPVVSATETIPVVENVFPASISNSPATPTLDSNLNLMEDFPQTSDSVESLESEPIVSPVVESVVPVANDSGDTLESVEPAQQVDSVESEEVSLTPFANEQSVGINSDSTVTPDMDIEVPLTQASEQQKVKKNGLNDTVVFIGVIVAVIVVAIIVLPFIFKAL